MSKTKAIDVRSAFLQAVALMRAENPSKPVSISMACQMAGINRANLYRNHASLLREVKENTPRKPAYPRGRTEKDLREKIASLQLRNDALMFLWLEAKSAPGTARLSTDVMREVEQAAQLRVAGGKFLREAVLSYLGCGIVDLSRFGSLDKERKQLLIQFLSLALNPTPPTLEAYDKLRKELESNSRRF